MLFGSSSKSTTKTTNVSKTYDERVAADGEAQVYRAGGDVNVLDGGVFDFAAAASRDSYDAVGDLTDIAGEITRRSMDFSEANLQSSQKAFQDFADKTRSDQAQFFDQLITYGIPAIALIFIAREYFK